MNSNEVLKRWQLNELLPFHPLLDLHLHLPVHHRLNLLRARNRSQDRGRIPIQPTRQDLVRLKEEEREEVSHGMIVGTEAKGGVGVGMREREMINLRRQQFIDAKTPSRIIEGKDQRGIVVVMLKVRGEEIIIMPAWTVEYRDKMINFLVHIIIIHHLVSDSKS